MKVPARAALRAMGLGAALAAAWGGSGGSGGELAAQELPGYSLGGSVEARPFARYLGSGSLEADELGYGQAASLGLELTATGERARAAASLEAALLSGAAASDAWAAAGASRLLGLDSSGLLLAPAYPAGAGQDSAESPPTLLVARVRTLYLKLDFDLFSLAAGRQVIKYQRGALWSPTDPFTELDLSGVSPVRRGADALRLVLPLGPTGALDLVAAPLPGFAEGRYAARLSGLLAGIDAAALGYRGDGAWSLGADFKADLLVGLDGEALYTIPDSGEGWLRAACGADYSYGRLLAAAEYYYNGGGPSADRNAPGQHNAYAALAWKATDFFSLSLSLVEGLSESSWRSALSASLDAAQNATLAAYASLAYAGGPLPWFAEAGLDIVVKF